METPPDMDPYEVRIGGVKADPMRICRAYGITDMGVQQAIKKLLRAGRKHKTSTEDKREAITSLQRSVEMDAEDERLNPHNPTDSQEHDWPEDSSHENGNYFCECVYCGEVFMGHKRRVVCKSCSRAATESPTCSSYCCGQPADLMRPNTQSRFGWEYKCERCFYRNQHNHGCWDTQGDINTSIPKKKRWRKVFQANAMLTQSADNKENQR